MRAYGLVCSAYLIPAAFFDSASNFAFFMHRQASVGAVSWRDKATSDGGLSEGAREDTRMSESPTRLARMAPEDRHESVGFSKSVFLAKLSPFSGSCARAPRVPGVVMSVFLRHQLN